MKKLILFILLFTVTLATQAQFTTGWDKAMNFGGAGADVEEMRYVNGDLYFVARMMGKYQFAGTNYDAGAILSYPDLDVLFGKITASGTQVLIQRFKSVDLCAVTSSARIGADGSLYIFRLGLGAEKTFGNLTAPAYGLQLLKVAANGQFDWVKKITTFSDIEFGTTGVASPTFGGMQVKDNGEIYVIFKSNTIKGSTYLARVIKLNTIGNEVWHYEMASANSGTSLSGVIINNMPKQFVDDNGNVTFKVATTGTISFNGETLPYEEPYTYAGFGNIKNWIISLDNTGQKKWSTSAYIEPTFYGVNPTNGEIYINYQYIRTSPVVAASIAPFSSLPNLAPPPALYVVPAYSWSGIITLNTSGGIAKTKSNYANAIAYPTVMQMADNGRILLYSATGNGSAFKAGNNFITFESSGYAAMEVDADFNPLTVFKLPAGSAIALDNNKFAFGGSFKTQTTIGNTTLIPNFIDTDFNTRFPNWASIKTDVLIAEGNLDNIPTELVNTTWLGTNTNWNDAANWSNGVPSTDTKVVFDANTTNMPSVATTPKAGQIVINNGVTASLPTALVVTDKIINNGILSINNALSYYNFTAYSAKAVEGDGEIFFNGTAAGAITYASLAFPTTNNSISLNHNIQFCGIVKSLKFLGTAALLTGGIEITSSDQNAITGYGPTKHVRGKITRAVSPSGTYVFPTDNYSPYEPTTITLNNLTGTSKITVGNDYKSTAPDVSFALGKTTAQLGDYGWSITPDVAPTSGTYDVSFQKSEFANGVADAERYVVLKRKDKNSPWSFEGTKAASTQTGGTTSGQTVSDATVTAGLTGLTSFSDFTIGVNSTAVPNNSTTGTTAWTGATNKVWNLASNWSNGIPNGLLDATIPAGLANYPETYSATDNARSLAIQAGINGLKLSATLVTNKGLITNSPVEVISISGTNNFFNGYGGGISGTGELRFSSLSEMAVATLGVVPNDIDINIGNTKTMWLNGKFGGNIKITSGLVDAPKGVDFLEQTNPNAIIQTTAAINNIAAEKLVKAVNSTGTYIFPLLDFATRYDARKYGEISITNNNIAGATSYGVSFKSNFVVGVAFNEGSDLYNSYLNSGQWAIEPTTFSTTGTIDVIFKTSKFTNGNSNVGNYVLLRRASSATNVSVPWIIVTGATITETAGVVTATATGIAPFSTNTMFCIGIKAGTTTWTGATSDNWNVATNWTSGVPDATKKAIFTSATRYPSVASTPTYGSGAAAIEVSSATTLTLPADFYAPNGIVNNGAITVSGSGTFYGFGGSTPSSLSGTGKLVFGSSSPTVLESYYLSNATINNGIEVNNPAGLALIRTTTFTGNVSLTNGVVTFNNAGQVFNMTNPNATITGSATSYIIGDLKRTVNATGTYNFPVGKTGVYAPASLNLNGLVGTTDITASFSAAAVNGQPNLTIGSQTLNSVLGSGTWLISPNNQPSAGNYSITLNAPLGSSTANNYYVLKRPGNYGTWANQGTNAESTVTAGIITASATGITSFSQFGIGEGFGTLPVKMVKFLASADAKFAKLYWETASELSNDKFVVERSINGIDFVNIGELKGNGTSQKLNTYSFRDLLPANGVNYYRLKQLDFNGNAEYSETRFVSFDLEAPIFTVYPNPATDVVNFSNAVKSVEIYNLQGSLLLQQNGSVSWVKIPTNVVSGLHLIKLKMVDDSFITKQLIIKK